MGKQNYDNYYKDYYARNREKLKKYMRMRRILDRLKKKGVKVTIQDVDKYLKLLDNK